MSRVYPGRFNTSDIGAVYVSREPETAIEELRRRAARDGVSLADMPPRSIFVIDLLLHEVVDLTAPG
jgi:RES domain-containing protein